MGLGLGSAVELPILAKATAMAIKGTQFHVEAVGNARVIVPLK